jgi:hypothetical protein
MEQLTKEQLHQYVEDFNAMCPNTYNKQLTQDQTDHLTAVFASYPENWKYASKFSEYSSMEAVENQIMACNKVYPNYPATLIFYVKPSTELDSDGQPKLTIQRMSVVDPNEDCSFLDS